MKSWVSWVAVVGCLLCSASVQAHLAKKPVTRLLFAKGKSSPKLSALRILRGYKPYLNQKMVHHIELHGHIDSSESRYPKLGLRRARRVKRLLQKLGVQTVIKVKNLAATRPVSKTSSYNRRVEVLLAYSPQRMTEATCLKYKGCGTSEPLALCGAGHSVTSLPRSGKRARWNGKTVTLWARAQKYGSRMTLLGCGFKGVCCNKASAFVAFTSAWGVIRLLPKTWKKGAVLPKRTPRCRGDRTRLCCPGAPLLDRTLHVTGVLHVHPKKGTLYLAKPTFCLVPLSFAEVPEAAMWKVFLEAVRNRDKNSFFTAFSQRVRANQSKSKVERFLKEADANLKKLFDKEYRLKDFTFVFQGKGRRGKLYLWFKGQKKMPFRMVEEQGKWKLDQN
ncbi:MAG: hypothetical protein EP343_28540 [Deltaproteobacteria bacterium]|nr:MAG: hypothetical protein EP343_28540 [Deltaproteobacteria bacterium]